MSLHYQNYTSKNFLGSSARLFYPLSEGGEGRKEGRKEEGRKKGKKNTGEN
jgi:hypothetical protein